MAEPIIGIDVSKDRLDAHRLADAARAAFANDAAGVAALLRWIGPAAGRVVFEATGRYHGLLERRLAAAGVAYVKVNPVQAKRFSQSLGVRAKTDPGDAALLARMAAALDLRPTEPCTKTQRELNALHAARQALIKDRTAARNRAASLELDLLKRQNAARLKRIAADLAAVEREIAARVEADPVLAERRAILTSIPGVSTVTADALITLAPELGALKAPKIAKLAGLAPITRRSGRWTGKAFTCAGRSALRAALFMPALAAMRFNPPLRAFAKRLKDTGKPALVVITAVMRKLIVLANALLRDRRNWTPKTS
jgi:transposase